MAVQPPAKLNIASIHHIFSTYIHSGFPLPVTVIRDKYKEDEQIDWEYYISVLTNEDFIESEWVNGDDDVELIIIELTKDGVRLSDLLENDSTKTEILKQFGKELAPKDLKKVIRNSSKLLEGLKEETNSESDQSKASETEENAQKPEEIIKPARAPKKKGVSKKVTPKKAQTKKEPTTIEETNEHSKSDSLKGISTNAARLMRGRNGLLNLATDRVKGVDSIWFQVYEDNQDKNLYVSTNNDPVLKEWLKLKNNTEQIRVNIVNKEDLAQLEIIHHFSDTANDKLAEMNWGTLYKQDADNLDKNIRIAFYSPKSPLADIAKVLAEFTIQGRDLKDVVEELKQASDKRKAEAEAKKQQKADPDNPENPGNTDIDVMDTDVVEEGPVSSALQSNDSAYGGQDLLGFEKDVKVFAALMALKSLKPPMAIALFGRWGTGKSFFMRHLMRRVDELATYQGFRDEKDKSEHPQAADGAAKKAEYCTGIAQIQFNAWSYLDSNLWAGLVVSIFEKLNEYLNDHTKGGVEKLKVQEKLTRQLSFYQDQKNQLLNERDGLMEIKKNLEDELARKETTKTNLLFRGLGTLLKKELVREASPEGELPDKEKLESISDEVKGQITALKSHYKALEDDPALKNALDLLQTKNALQGVKKISNAFFQSAISRKGMLLVIAALVLIPAGIYTYNQFGSAIEDIKIAIYTAVGTFITRFTQGISFLRDKISHLNQFNEVVEKLSDQAPQDFKACQNRLEENREHLEQAEIDLEELDKEIAAAQRRLKEDHSSQALVDFINNRENSNDYQKHLGLISVIRKDFETLSELFAEINAKDLERKRAQAEKKDKLIDGEAKRQAQLAKNQLEIRDQFEEGHQLQRIILYIDDLDRCDDEKVLDVLQAVHLLMAYPLFIVVVGVDKRCVNNALNYRNILQYCQATGVTKASELKEKFGVEIIQPNEYLEKIFQIPFQLLEPDEEGVHNMIESLFEKEEDTEAGSEADAEEDNESDDDGGDDSGEVGSDDAADEDALGEGEAETPPAGDEEDEGEDKEDGPVETLKSGALDISNVEDSSSQDKATPTAASTPPAAGAPVPEDDGEIPKNEADSAAVDKPEEKKEAKKVYVLERPPNLDISEEEKDLIKEMSIIVGKSPRTIKRYVNMYRVIRARGDIKFEEKQPNEEATLIMFLLAMELGEYKDRAFKIFEEVAKLSGAKQIKTVLREHHCGFLVTAMIEKVKNEEGQEVPARPTLNKIANTRASELKDLIKKVERFSFGRMILPRAITSTASDPVTAP